MTTIGWYGPLIDLSKAHSHIGDYVQLLVFVHKSTPIQCKSWKGGGGVTRTDIQVGDDTRPFFPVTIWQKQMGSMAVAGDVILLQNVRITRIQHVVEARTVQFSSLQSLLHPCESLCSKSVDDLIGVCRIGITAKEKLKKVIKWVQRLGASLHNVVLHSYQDSYQEGQFPKNWKSQDAGQSQDCFSLSEILCLTDASKANFYASVGEIFLPLNFNSSDEYEEERMFISRRLSIMGDKLLVEDLICNGCQLCGSPLNSDIKSAIEPCVFPLYCNKSSNRLHAVSLIYRPFMLYVWDASRHILLLVTNKAAEQLFGNISAEKVFSCHKTRKHRPGPESDHVSKNKLPLAKNAEHIYVNRAEITSADSPDAEKAKGFKAKHSNCRKLDFFSIWLIMVKLLLQQGKNSPLKFKVTVDASRECDGGRYELVSVSLPCS